MRERRLVRQERRRLADELQGFGSERRACAKVYTDDHGGLGLPIHETVRHWRRIDVNAVQVHVRTGWSRGQAHRGRSRTYLRMSSETPPQIVD